jgi:hypothetical protein
VVVVAAVPAAARPREAAARPREAVARPREAAARPREVAVTVATHPREAETEVAKLSLEHVAEATEPGAEVARQVAAVQSRPTSPAGPRWPTELPTERRRQMRRLQEHHPVRQPPNSTVQPTRRHLRSARRW